MAGSGQRRLQGGGRRTQRGGRYVVVVESPAKAKTIGAWLGPPYRVMATRGHVRDLPAKAGSVDPGDGFSMVYETGKAAARTLGAIARALENAEGLILATDPDREGEAIAWQVLDWLTERDAIGGRRVERATFHEVTEEAVRAALDNPRGIDMDLVRAWQARRALDYLVGYSLSPVLWRKLPGCRSAGRVQSVARADPAGAGPQAARPRLGRLPRPHRRRDREHRLRAARPFRVHREPDGRGHGARCLAAGFGRHRGCHADPHPRLLQPGPVMARVPKYALAAAGVGILLAMAAVQPGQAAEWRSWCGAPGSGASLGWHFYCDRDDREAEERPVQPAPQSSPSSARERILEMRRQLEEARAAAILDPSPAKVTTYLRLQQETLQRAAAFSDAFRRTVWATPELDYTLKRPVGALAKRLWSDERRAAVAGALARLGERYGLIYLGHTGCGGCRVFGPLLRAFAARHGLDVLAVSLTGGPLEGWPEAVPDNGRAAKLGLAGTPVPAVVLFDTQTKKVLPVGFGVMAEDQLAERIFTLTALEPGNDY